MSINAGMKIREAFSSPEFVRTYLDKEDEYGEERGLMYARKIRLTGQICRALRLDELLTCGILTGMELASTAFGYIGEAFARGFDPDFLPENLAVAQMSAVLAGAVRDAAELWRNADSEDPGQPEDASLLASLPAHAAARAATAALAIMGHESARIQDGLRHALIGTDACAEELLARMMFTAAYYANQLPDESARNMSLIMYKQSLIRLSAERHSLTEPDVHPPQEPREAKRKICVSEALAVLQTAQKFFAEDPERIPEHFRDAFDDYDTEAMAAIYAVGMTEAALRELAGEEGVMKEFPGVTRFYRDQDMDYAQALLEVKTGKKRSHWIWYIFPQLRGLGRSEISNYYGIASLDEAKEYLADPVLSERLLEISTEFLRQDGTPISVFGTVDATKVRSCMTLFSAAAEKPEQRAVFNAVLEKHFGGERCRLTLDMLEGKDPWRN